MKNDDGCMKDDDFKLLRGFADRRMNGRTDICDCRVAFTTEKGILTLCYLTKNNYNRELVYFWTTCIKDVVLSSLYNISIFNSIWS